MAPEAPRSNSEIIVGAEGATVNSRGRSPRYPPPTKSALEGPRIERDRENCQLGECPANEQANASDAQDGTPRPCQGRCRCGVRTGGFAPGY